MKLNKNLILVVSVAAPMLAGCATLEDVKRAQLTADQAVAAAQAAQGSADRAQSTADQGVAAAQRAQNSADRAQATADKAVAAAKVADDKAQAAGDAAAENKKVFWQHHDTHHRHRRPR